MTSEIFFLIVKFEVMLFLAIYIPRKKGLFQSISCFSEYKDPRGFYLWMLYPLPSLLLLFSSLLNLSFFPQVRDFYYFYVWFKKKKKKHFRFPAKEVYHFVCFLFFLAYKIIFFGVIKACLGYVFLLFMSLFMVNTDQNFYLWKNFKFSLFIVFEI